MGDTTTDQTGTADGATDQGKGQQEQQQSSDGSQKAETFTQADVDRIVGERVQRERAKYADYDDLKAKAGKSATAEERVAALEKRATEAEARALRSDIAAKHGISAEDRDLFLTGTDEDTLAAQAKRLAAREAEHKKNGNYVSQEGRNPKGAKATDERAAVRELFGSGG